MLETAVLLYFYYLIHLFIYFWLCMSKWWNVKFFKFGDLILYPSFDSLGFNQLSLSAAF